MSSTRVLARALPAALTALLVAGGTPVRVAAQPAATGNAPYPARCGAYVSGSDVGRFVPLPRGDLWCPLIADPKAIRSFVSYQRGDAADFARNVAAVGIADQFAFFRIAGARAGDGIQLGVSAAVFAQFDLDAPSFDLLNADYLIGIPITWRRGGFSGRARVYHQSSHLGDELLLRPDRPERENLSFESAELLLSQDVGPLRVYGGGEYFFNRTPADLADRLAHAGAEYRSRGGARVGSIGSARLVAAVDVKVVDNSTWRTGVSARAGVEVGRAREGAVPGRRWQLLGEFYDGPSPYGQFVRSTIRLVGVGFHFTL